VRLEGTNNAARHAHADILRLTVIRAGDRLEVEVEDDGIGMANPTRSSGLANLRKRAIRHHGAFTIISTHDHGTTLRWTGTLA
jgi:signal transduction histidine kinase